MRSCFQVVTSRDTFGRRAQFRAEPVRHTDISSLPLETVLYVPVEHRANLSTLDNQLHRLPSSLRRSADLVVLRTHAPEAQALLTDETLTDKIAHRLEGRPVALLTFANGSIRFVTLTSDAPQDSQLRVITMALRHSELTALARQPGVYLGSGPSHHYEGPNGLHYASFLRVGTALQSLDALDALTFWLLPFLASETTLILDSGSILSLGLNVVRYLADCGYTNEFRVRAIDYLRSYAEPAQAVLQRLRLAENQSPGAALAIVSVTSTGALRERLLPALQSAGFAQTNCVSLYASSAGTANDSSVFCRLPETPGRYQPSDCALCKNKSAVVRIDPRTYLLEVAASTETVRVTLRDARTPRVFFERYRGLPFIALHRDQHDRQRHHMIHLDIETLRTHPSFLDQLSRLSTSLGGRADVVLAPRHAAAEALARTVATSLSRPLILCDEHELSTLSVDDRRRLRRSRQLLIVDDVIISGDRLRQYKHFLRVGGFVGRDPEIRCLVGVARPDTDETFEAITDMICRVGDIGNKTVRGHG
jgi:hypothetical protein